MVFHAIPCKIFVEYIVSFTEYTVPIYDLNILFIGIINSRANGVRISVDIAWFSCKFTVSRVPFLARGQRVEFFATGPNWVLKCMTLTLDNLHLLHFTWAPIRVFKCKCLTHVFSEYSILHVWVTSFFVLNLTVQYPPYNPSRKLDRSFWVQLQ